MKRYGYRVWGWDGSYHTGTLEALSEAHAKTLIGQFVEPLDMCLWTN